MFGGMTSDTDDRLVKRAIAAYVRTSEAALPEMPSDSGVATWTARYTWSWKMLPASSLFTACEMTAC